jgi:hypothetical protein
MSCTGRIHYPDLGIYLRDTAILIRATFCALVEQCLVGPSHIEHHSLLTKYFGKGRQRNHLHYLDGTKRRVPIITLVTLSQ